MDVLHLYHCDGLALIDSVRACTSPLLGDGAEPVYALLYSPAQCQLARVIREGNDVQVRLLQEVDGQLLEVTFPSRDSSAVYEARVFSRLAELRWQNDASGMGRHHSALIVEQEAAPIGAWHHHGILLAKIIEQSYLVWGRSMQEPVAAGALPIGWSRMASDKARNLMVPIAGVKQGGRVVLTAREYCAKDNDLLSDKDDVNGNVVVFEERLTGLLEGAA